MTEDKTKQMKNIAKLLALHEISEMAGGADELGRILQHLCACILDAANVPRGALVVRDENNNSFRVAVCQGLPDAFRDEYIELTRDLLFERRLFSRDELIIDEVEDLAEQSYKEMYLKCGITRRIVLPLTVRERTIGLLEFYPDPKCRVSKEQTDQCLLLAHLVAVAVDNSAIFSHAERLATTDGVTGVLNFTTFRHQLTLEAKRARRYNMALSLIMIEIDNFRSIIHTYGHFLGNEVLSEFSAILKAGVRDVDLVARCTGDEFAIALPETPGEGAMILANRLFDAVRTNSFLGPGTKKLRLTASIGVAEYHDNIAGPEELIDQAAKALHEAKSAGEDIVRIGAPQEQ